jgi:hypothetical protein
MSLNSRTATVSKEIPKKHTPMVQEDLFYVSSSEKVSIASMPIDRLASRAKSTSKCSDPRALRFSSPLESSHKQKTTGSRRVRSNLKQRPPSAEGGQHVKALEVSSEHVNVQQSPVVVNNPVSFGSGAPTVRWKLTSGILYCKAPDQLEGDIATG